MLDTRVKISSIVENQLPDFVKEEFPLVKEFLSQYYSSQEIQGGTIDLFQNIDKYIKLDQLTRLSDATVTTSELSFTDDTINVETTAGFPNSYGLLKINSEIITYKSKTSNTFNECVRGFSGVTSLEDPTNPNNLIFSSTSSSDHSNGSVVENLSILFLKEFFIKVKRQFAPGFDERSLFSGLNQNIFIKQAKDFYSSKGTDQSFEILFRALYGEDVEVIKPRDYLFIPSNAEYRTNKNLVVEALEGDPFDLINRTLYQDEDLNFNKAFGSVSDVEKISRGGKDYYIISLDYNTNIDNDQSNFSIHSQTKLVTDAPIGSKFLDVDSTIGFPNSGSLVVFLENGTTVNIEYTSKSYTQFYGCSGVDQNLLTGQNITINSYAYGYSNIENQTQVKLRITGVLSSLNYSKDTTYYEEGSSIQIKTLGVDSKDIKANNWIFNIPTSYDVAQIELIDLVNFYYKVTTTDSNNFFIGNELKLIFTDGTEIVSSILEVLNSNSFIIGNQGQINVDSKYKVQKLVSKTKSLNFPETNIYGTDVQNVYQDYSDLNSFYVSSSSLPNYLNQSLSVGDRSVTFSGTFNGEDLNIGLHSFYTGDAIFYSPQSTTNNLGIESGIYFVERITSSIIKLARSRSNLYERRFISFDATVTNNKIISNDLANQSLDNQKIVRNIKSPQNSNKTNTTPIGPTGILVNGVEILNYKSNDVIYYGPIENIDILSNGSDYDVINPPLLSISDQSGSGADGYCEVEGSIQEIQIIDGGFDYIEEPIITITGGSGSGAELKARLSDFSHEVSFNSTGSAGQVNLLSNTVGFSSYHKFRDAEKIIYKPDGLVAVGGLSTDSVYYASVQDAFTVSFHKTSDDAFLSVNPINLTSYGIGNHRFVSYGLKKKISSVLVSNSGSGYRNRKISVSSVGINTFSNSINTINHGYSSGDIIVYSASGTEIGGLVSGQSYYVTAIDNNSFKLSNIGTGTTIGIGSAIVGVTTSLDFYYKTNQYINFTGVGTGDHLFNYPPIKIEIGGKVGVSTRTNQSFNAVLQPIVRGEIKSIFLKSGGSNYGSEEIINFNRQPSITLQRGVGAEVIPVISEGKIIQVLVTNPGSGYNSPPTLLISGSGTGAKLTPIIFGGQLLEVKVISGGVGYDSPRITVISSGSGAEFQSTATKWTINLVERYISTNQIVDDDGIIFGGINSNYGSQYTHLYSPRKLRQTILSSKIIDGEISYVPDLKIENGREVTSDSHSPIIGWAYDGNPIYGPYGYSSITGGSIRALESGYGLSLKNNRPSTTLYKQGFFVEDYQYLSKGDLDEHNGRFCVTPEFPKGVYAYFTTINTGNVDSSPPFRNFRRPVFPYFIGNTYKSSLNDFNTSPESNQDNFDLTDTTLVRNTTPYNLLKNNSGYDFILNPNTVKKQTSIIRYTKNGVIDSVKIKSGGSNYKVGDKVTFDNIRSGGQGSSAEVSQVKGKPIDEISVSNISLSGVEFVPFRNGTVIGFSTSPHNLLETNILTITGISTFATNLEGTYNVGISSDTFLLVSGIGTTGSTGIVTYFNVYGSLIYPSIRENDVLQVGSEKVKVLNVDRESSRIRIIREYDGSVGSSHNVSDVLYEKSRKFVLNSSINLSSNYNKEIYFNPIESIGIGTTSGVGIGVTLYFSNPGVGASTLFVPTRSIYLPDHRLNTGDKLIYSSNGESPISVSNDGITSFQLIDDQVVYAARITDNLIGISTFKVGLGSTGTFVGINSSIIADILYFTNTGSGEIHSFTTNYENVITGEVDKNLVTVYTSQTHGLDVNDTISLSCLSGISTTYVIQYDDCNRRIVINPKTFSSGDVDSSNDSIQIISHGYVTGQKVIHTSSNPSSGLENGGIYFVIKIDNNRFKLSKTYYGAIQEDPEFVDITSPSFGSLSLINPPIFGIKNQEIIFDVSDISLSYTSNLNRYSAFDLNFYTDSSFNKIFESQSNAIIVRSGRLGVDANATVSIKLNDSVPNTLYYRLDPKNFNENNQTKLEIISDSENILDNNKILVSNSAYSGTHTISGIGSTTFSYNIKRKPERLSYNKSESSIFYKTNSTSVLGEIDSIKITSRGKNYKILPEITGINSLLGSNAIIEPLSSTIGKVVSTEIIDIGFEYPSDITLRPTAKLPQILKLDLLSSFERIGISSIGKNYTIAPELIVIDSVSNKVVSDVDLKYTLGSNQVIILKNTRGINNTIPSIIPINNSNGIGINSISYNESTKEVTVGLAVSYSSSLDYPFAVGDKVIIENINVGIGTSLRGYNSSSYDYALFTITSIDPNIGGANGTISYSLNEFLQSGENPGIFDISSSSGKITPQKFFPTFDITLKKNDFRINEVVSTQNASGIVEKWYPDNEILVVSTVDDFTSGDTIQGESSETTAVIENISSSNAIYDVDAYSIVKNNWKTESGFLNNDYQRIHDSNYYQYFSYALKSKVEYEDWKDPVISMNHTVGFKKFSDLIVESFDPTFSGISTAQNSGDFTSNVDFISVVGLNCVNDFDLATENNITIDSRSISDEVIFNSSTIQDYFESVGNRVLTIDDISQRFNSNPRPTQFSVVDSFDLTSARSKKYFSYIVDKRFIGEKQISIATLLHDNSFGFLNQYGRVETESDLGSFDFIISGTEGQILFYPVKYQANDYNINLFAYDIKDSISGIGTVNLGDTVKIYSSSKTIPVGFSTTTTLVGIASTYRASKVLIQYAASDNSYYEFDEITLVHDGSDVQILDYGQLSTNILSPLGSIGIGTYNAHLSGSQLNLEFTPNVGLGVTYSVNSIIVSIANTSSSGVSSSILSSGILESRITSIASSTSPIENVISEFENPYSCSYYIVSLEDTSNNTYQVSEVLVATAGTVSSMTEFGILQTESVLGNFNSKVVGQKTQLTFTPKENTDIQVRVFQNALSPVNFNFNEEIDLVSASINSANGTYEGTETDIRRFFDLTHNGLPIFRRNILGNSSSVVDVTNNLIRIPNHYFVSGEELIYTYQENGIGEAIGISTEIIVGVGTTNKLPETVYAIKINDASIRLASSVENALKTVPIPLTISSVGIGTVHSFTSKKQNSRVLVTIDNVIQSPIVSSAITATLLDDVSPIDQSITVSGITSFFSGDLIQVDDEVMRIESVGFGSANIFLVKRPWMGTEISSHNNSSLVTKVDGDYNIIDNTINFVTAPYGQVPIGSITAGPSNVDYLGISTYSKFSGRNFMRSGIPNTNIGPYDKNYIFDDISSGFNGFSTSFTLTSDKQNITGISTDNSIILVNQIFQGPQKTEPQVNFISDYVLKENSGITSVQFSGSTSLSSYDVNTSSLPRGGIIVSVGSTRGFGYQPLVSAGGTSIVSGLGTISSISIGNSGSGYRSGIQTVRVGIKTESVENSTITYIGTASINNGNVVSVAITNPGIGYTTSNPPIVIFDAPLSYSNIPLIYSSSSPNTGFGTGAKVNVVVGQGSSVVDFEIINFGYGYGQNETLTIGIGGTVGIPTNSSLAYEEFQLTVDRTYSDSFSGWSIGNLLVLDQLDNLFDGIKRSFQITVNGLPRSIKSKTGSNINVQSTLLVFINDILQVPGEGYTFKGGSYIDFSEAPKNGDKSKILFYQGTSDIDVISIDVLETIKPGDLIRLNDDNISYKQNERLVTSIVSIDTLETNSYSGPGISVDPNYARPVIWCKQTEDLFINGKEITKDRVLYEPLIYPNTRIIQSIGTGTTIIFVESVKTFFDSTKENYSGNNKIRIVSQNEIVGAAATAIVSIAGTISSIIISNSGIGYTSTPTVTIGNPVGLGTTLRASATASVSSGSVASISVTSPGSGYTSTNPPVVLIETPQISDYIEDISSVTYEGDFGIISGISTSSIGIASTAITFDFVIPTDSFLRNSSIVGTAITISGIQTGYYFVVYNSNVGGGVTSLRQDNSIVSVGNSFLDNVYYVSQVSIAQTNVTGFGVTYVAKVTVSVSDYNNLSGIGYSEFYGEYSWGKIVANSRPNPKSFDHYNNGLVGVSSSPMIERYNPLKYLNYT